MEGYWHSCTFVPQRARHEPAKRIITERKCCRGMHLTFTLCSQCLAQVVIRGKDDVQNTGRLPDLRSAAQGLRLIDMPGSVRPPLQATSQPGLPVQFPMQFNAPPRPAQPGQSPLAALVSQLLQQAHYRALFVLSMMLPAVQLHAFTRCTAHDNDMVHHRREL